MYLRDIVLKWCWFCVIMGWRIVCRFLLIVKWCIVKFKYYIKVYVYFNGFNEWNM